MEKIMKHNWEIQNTIQLLAEDGHLPSLGKFTPELTTGAFAVTVNLPTPGTQKAASVIPALFAAMPSGKPSKISLSLAAVGSLWQTISRS
jgi:hypothetical protein